MIRLSYAIGLSLYMLAGSCSSPMGKKADRRAPDEVGKRPRNFIIFVTDGLRPGSVTRDDAPTLAALRDKGVFFKNSHSLFPTFTTANAAAIATGHYLGDTGDFSNTVYTGYELFSSGAFAKKSRGTVTPFLENDATIADIDEHFAGNFLSEDSLLAIARAHGYGTAAIGKLGPVLLQDATQSDGLAKQAAATATIIIDDATGSGDGMPLAPEVIAKLKDAGMATAAPRRDNGSVNTPKDNGFGGSNVTPGTTTANVVQQQFFADATTKAVLPLLAEGGKPFGVIFWSRDPDGSQHNQGDSLGHVAPGINGPTSRSAVRNVDNNLKQILSYLEAHPEIAANTDLFVTADHGFSTISRHDLDASGSGTQSYAQSQSYRDASGRLEVDRNFLPPGFLAIDLAHELKEPLFDPDEQASLPGASKTYKRVDPTFSKPTDAVSLHPRQGNGLIGGTGALGGSDAKVVVAANGGSDLIYLPSHDAALAKRLVTFLASQDYVSGLFADDAFGDLPGALPLSAINLVGTARLPKPSIVVSFRTFTTDPNDPYQHQVEIADTGLQQGQGMHGSFGRGDTFNNMTAVGPDFKAGYVDASPVSNADVAVTIAHLLNFPLSAVGKLHGRVISEALVGAGDGDSATRSTLKSKPAEGSGMVTILDLQTLGDTKYFDAAGFSGRSVGLSQ